MSTLTRALIVAVPVCLLLLGSVVALVAGRTTARLFWLFGSLCLTVVVVAHVAEAMRWLPSMGWGRPDSVGHYIDLTAAISGVCFLMTALALTRRRSA